MTTAPISDRNSTGKMPGRPPGTLHSSAERDSWIFFRSVDPPGAGLRTSTLVSHSPARRILLSGSPRRSVDDKLLCVIRVPAPRRCPALRKASAYPFVHPLAESSRASPPRPCACGQRCSCATAVVPSCQSTRSPLPWSPPWPGLQRRGLAERREMSSSASIALTLPVRNAGWIVGSSNRSSLEHGREHGRAHALRYPAARKPRCTSM
jgi:hypothetical protein